MSVCPMAIYYMYNLLFEGHNHIKYKFQVEL